MVSYPLLVAAGVLRVLVLFGVVGVLCGRFVFPLRPRGGVAAWGGTMAMLAVLVLMVHGLVLVRLFDGFGLLLALAGLLGAVWYVRGGSPATGGRDVMTGLLDRREGARPDAERRAAWRPGAGFLLVLVLGAAAAVRLWPVIHEAAPFSVQFYEIVETTKALRVGDLGTGEHFPARGLHSLLLAVFATSRVDVLLLTRIFGVVATLLVMAGLFYTVRGVTGRSTAALAAAAVFGLTGELLPFSLPQQVEASPAMLALAFALPAVVFSGRALLNGRRLDAVVGGLCATAALLTHPVTGLLALGGVVLAAVLVPEARRRWRQAVAVVAGPLVLAALPWAAAAGLGAEATSLLEARRGLPPFQRLDPVVWAGPAAAAMGVLLVVLGLRAASAKRRAACRGIGAVSVLLAGLWAWTQSGAEPPLRPDEVGAVLAAVLCVEGALLLDVATRALARRTAGRAATFVHRATVLAAVVVVAGLGRPLVPQFGYTVEPAGFAAGLHAVDARAEPYAWTVVGPHSAGIRALQRGRYMDYAYFLNNYDPLRYDHLGPEAVPTPDLFVLVEKDAGAGGVLDELMPMGDDLMYRAQAWIDAYGRRTETGLSVFYEDEAVRIYRLSRPPDRKPHRGRS